MDRTEINLCLLCGQTLEELGYISATEWAKEHGYASRHVADMISHGRLPGLKHKGHWYVLKGAFRACPAVCGHPVEKDKHYCSDCGRERSAASNRENSRRIYARRRKPKNEKIAMSEGFMVWN